MNRRQFLASAAATLATTALARAATSVPATTQSADKLPDNLVWHDVRDWGVEGRAFDDTAEYFHRLPGRAKEVVRGPVWNLATQTAGMSVRFTADTPALYVRYEVRNERLDMAHMPATGVSGVDLYAMTDAGWRWAATHLPASPSIAAAFKMPGPLGKRKFLMHLPLYNGVKSLEIGVSPGATFEPIAPRKSGAILFYGTSITQGGCASRPGMAFPAIVGRKLDRPVYNFGFSGNGRTELEVARFLAEVDASVFVLDCLSNTDTEGMKERTIPVIRLLRKERPKMAILMLGARYYANAPLNPATMANYEERETLYKGFYDQLLGEGMQNLHHLWGRELIGDDSEGTVDGSHPSDLGMLRYAEVLEPALRKIM